MAAASPKPARILVLDADQVSALAVVRSLSRRGYIVEIASASEAPIASFSRAARRCWRYPDPLLDELAFLAWLQEHLALQTYDLLMPVTERTLVPLSRNCQQFAEVPLAMAEVDSLNRVLDKAETFRLAAALDICVPASIPLRDIGELAACAAGIAFPIVVKPSHSVVAGGAGYSKQHVSYAHNESELRKLCQHSLQHGPVLLQEYFEGQGAGIELIALDGEILYAFQHLRLHEVPLTGGGSSFRVSAAVEPALLHSAEKLIHALRWTGVAMVEFKWDPLTRRSCLMEVNGRFWGSLPLAVAAGADFPAMQAELFLTGALGTWPPYRSGVYCRNLASDLMWHELVLRRLMQGRSTDEDLVRLPSGRQILRDLARVLSPRHYFDTQSFRDPLPGLVEIQRLAVRYGTRLSGVIADHGFALYQRFLWRCGVVERKLGSAGSVLFVCYGNINRSALAEVILSSLLPADSSKRVLSAGFHQVEYRAADERMQRIGVERGFDLSRCRSLRISPELIDSSDIIFVMEKKHRDELLLAYPGVGSKIFLLGPGSSAAGQGACEIMDPYNQSEAVYRNCFLQIHQAVARLGESLHTRHARR